MNIFTFSWFICKSRSSISADKSSCKETNTRHLYLCVEACHLLISTQVCANDKMCERVCLHLLPWEETSAAGYQRPPVGLRLAAADLPARWTDPLSARAKTAGRRAPRRETAVLLDCPMIWHLTQSGFDLFEPMNAWCVKCDSHRKSSLHAGWRRLAGF